MTALRPAEPRLRKVTVDEYYQMADLGFFQDQRVELIDGEIIEMPAMHDVHVAAVTLTEEELRRVFGTGYWVRVQAPLHLSQLSEPEPDLAVVRGGPRDYVGTGHPTSALLVVEVSETTLDFDRRRKASLYAAAGLADYWIVNLVDYRLEVLRTPTPDASQAFGFRYADVITLDRNQSVAPIAAPSVMIRVSELRP